MPRLLHTRRSPPREAHIKTTSLSVLLATYSGERRHNLSAETSSPKDMNLWSLGNLGCKDILEVTTLCLKRGVLLDCCSRAKRITMVVVFLSRRIPVFVFVTALHLHTFAIYLWTMHVDKAWFSSLSSIRAVNSSSCYQCKAIVNKLESRQFFIQEAFFKRTSPSLLFTVMFLSHYWTMNKLLKVSLALDVLLCKGFVLKRATLFRICWL